MNTAGLLGPAEPTGESSPVVRFEMVLAVGRIFMAAAGLVAIYVDPTEPAAFVPVVYALLGGFFIYAVALLVVLRQASGLSYPQAAWIHTADILWSVLLTVFSEGPASSLVFFFLFTQVAAAYRWGFRATAGTAGIAVAVILAEVAIAYLGPFETSWLDAIRQDLSRVVLRAGYFLTAGFLLGYLSEEQRRYRNEMRTIADVARRTRMDVDLGAVLGSIARIAHRAFEAAAVDIVLKDLETNRAVRVAVGAAEHDGAPDAIPQTPEEEQTWLFPDAGQAWQLFAGQQVARVTAVDTWPLRRSSVVLPEHFGDGRAWRAVTAGNLGVAGEWQARIYLWDVGMDQSREHQLHFLESLLAQVTPAVTSVLLMRRLHLRAGAAERARVARELHDGAIQSLFGIEMRVEAMLRGQPDTVRWSGELREIQAMLRTEVQELRELMLALRPIELDSGDQLPDVLASLVERFRRDSGMGARFVAVGRPSGLSAATAVEIVRIVQEALVNARKHSSARNVLVRLTCGERDCHLLIEDDGVGFPFEGRYTIGELDARRIGPTIIKERARIAGAELVLQSSPGRGASLQFDIPLVMHA